VTNEDTFIASQKRMHTTTATIAKIEDAANAFDESEPSTSKYAYLTPRDALVKAPSPEEKDAILALLSPLTMLSLSNSENGSICPSSQKKPSGAWKLE